MSLSEELTSILMDYIKRPQTDYAVMLQGSWGTGKTYFWDKQMKPLLNSIGYKDIYVSLYGLGSIKQVTQSMFMSFWTTTKTISRVKRILDSRQAQAITEVGRAIITGATYLHSIPIPKLPKFDFDFNKLLMFNGEIVLCFDDLERTKIDLEELFGFINGFVERDKIKVIMIGNEEEIKSNDYPLFKEKLVGLTVDFKPGLLEVIKQLANIYIQEDNNNFRNFIELNSEIIEALCVKSGESNIRVIKRAFGIFYSVYNLLMSFYKEVDDSGLKKLLLFTLASSFEILTGETGSNELLEFGNDFDFRVIFYARQRKGEIDNQELNYLENFVQKYYVDISEFVFSKAITQYIKTGFLNKKHLISECGSIVSPDFDKEKLFFNQYWKLSDEEFDQLVFDIARRINKGLYSISECPYIFSSLLYFIDNNLVDWTILDLKNMILNCIDKTQSTGMAEVLNMNLSYLRSGLAQDQSIIFDEIINRGEERKKELEKLIIQNIAKELTVQININFDAFCRLLWTETNRLKYIPILQEMDMSLLTRYLTSTKKNSDIVLLRNSLSERYKPTNVIEFLNEEISALESLNTELKLFCQKSSFKLKTHLIQELCKTLEEFINKLSSNG